MRICVEKLFYSLLFLLTLIGIAHGQAQSTLTWRTIISPNGEFSITVPEPLVVHQEKRWGRTKIVGGAQGAGFELSFDNNSMDDKTQESVITNRFQKGSQSAFKLGRYKVRLHKYEGDNIYREMVLVSSPKASYSFLMTAPTVDKPIVESVLASIRLNDQQVLTDVSAGPIVTRDSVNAKELEVSEIVLAALKRKQGERIVAEVVKGKYLLPYDETVYSRPGLIVSVPLPKYTDEARGNNVQGSVRLRIQLKANGNVGKIQVLEGLPFGLTEQALLAASQIKFIPAEVGGKPSDFEVTREYTFTIY